MIPLAFAATTAVPFAGFLSLALVIALAVAYARRAREVNALYRWAQPALREPDPTPAPAPRRRRRLATSGAVAVAAIVAAIAALGVLGQSAGSASRTPAAKARPLAAANVRVLNATATPGMAERAAATLRRRGLHVTGVGNARTLQQSSTVVFDGDDRGAASVAARSLGVPLRADAYPKQPAPGTDVVVLLGQDVH